MNISDHLLVTLSRLAKVSGFAILVYHTCDLPMHGTKAARVETGLVTGSTTLGTITEATMTP